MQQIFSFCSTYEAIANVTLFFIALIFFCSTRWQDNFGNILFFHNHPPWIFFFFIIIITLMCVNLLLFLHVTYLSCYQLAKVLPYMKSVVFSFILFITCKFFLVINGCGKLKIFQWQHLFPCISVHHSR